MTIYENSENPSKEVKHRHMTTFRLISISFFFLILTGAILLTLPIASAKGNPTNFLDALFTATSASCVTGLIVHDTATYWNLFGEVVIIALIQVGGMGVVTMAIALGRFSGKKIGLMQRTTMADAISAPNVGGIVRLTNFILRAAIVIEVIGAVLMMFVFIPDFGVAKGIWFSFFHSISSFCNAGFDLMGVRKPGSSLTTYASNPIINIAVMLLIIIGGIGFMVWDDIRAHGIHFHRYRLQTKTALVVTLFLIFLPAIFFYFHEFQTQNQQTRILMSLFQSVTTRTAGYNTADLDAMSDPAKLIMILLMLIGGSPGSTAGGMKTTTFFVMLASALSVFHRRGDTVSFGRSIPSETVRSAAAIFMMYIVFALTGGIAISCIENLPTMDCLFEASSAIGTVGLTLGITSGLHAASKIILIFLMYMGRVGGLTLIFAASSDFHRCIIKYPKEDLTVG